MNFLIVVIDEEDREEELGYGTLEEIKTLIELLKEHGTGEGEFFKHAHMNVVDKTFYIAVAGE